MAFELYAACGCNVGNLRMTNEDNFFFHGQCLEEVNRGLAAPLTMNCPLDTPVCVAVFDGMGGEECGEVASHAAAEKLKSISAKEAGVRPGEEALEALSADLNLAVVQQKRALHTEKMGTTQVLLCFDRKQVYACNLGDSRAYRLRDGELEQLSRDHVSQLVMPGQLKAPLNQYLGIDPGELRLVPTIVKGKLKLGDTYLLCSDGLTDMVSEEEIRDILQANPVTRSCVTALIDAALKNGGMDNVTVIVCSIL